MATLLEFKPTISKTAAKDTEYSVQKHRIEKGQCIRCGMQVMDVTGRWMWKRACPRTQTDFVFEGRCLHCFPLTSAPLSTPPSIQGTSSQLVEEEEEEEEEEKGEDIVELIDFLGKSEEEEVEEEIVLNEGVSFSSFSRRSVSTMSSDSVPVTSFSPMYGARSGSANTCEDAPASSLDTQYNQQEHQKSKTRTTTRRRSKKKISQAFRKLWRSSFSSHSSSATNSTNEEEADTTKQIIRPSPSPSSCNNDMYRGQSDGNGKFHGYGNFHWSETGNTYEGDWRHGQRHGYGIYKWSSANNYYSGLWEHDVPSGLGKFTSNEEGGHYIGTFSFAAGGTLEGNAIFLSKNRTDVNHFQSGQPKGQGARFQQQQQHQQHHHHQQQQHSNSMTMRGIQGVKVYELLDGKLTGATLPPSSVEHYQNIVERLILDEKQLSAMFQSRTRS